MRLLVALCLIAVVAAAPPAVVNYSNNNVNLVRYENNAYEEGKYNFEFEQTDGQKREEQGQVKNAGTENESLVVKGSYRWVGPDGVEYLVIYVADENGYQPEVQQGAGGALSPQVASLFGYRGQPGQPAQPIQPVQTGALNKPGKIGGYPSIVASLIG